MTQPTMPEPCDCLIYCGDDPWLADGRSTPCAVRASELAFNARCAAVQAAMPTTKAKTTAGHLARCLVPRVLTQLESTPDRRAYWRELLGALRTWADVDIARNAATPTRKCGPRP
jgi:hypothetical protein